MKKIRGLRKRWLMNTVGVVCILGMVCVLVVTLAFAAYYYSFVESDLRYRAGTTADFFAEYLNQSYNDYYQSCINYAKTFEHKDRLELQFISTKGRVVATSYGTWLGEQPKTNDIREAIDTRNICVYNGTDPITKEHIIAVSCPMIYSNGEVIGVLRYVTSAQIVDGQIYSVALLSLLALAVVVFILLISSNYYIHSILVPMAEITEKAKRITSGSYGIQIQSKYDDEIGELVDTINLPTFSGIPYDQSLIVETENRLIFTDDLFTWVPKYYIEKSELGTGKAKVYSFKLPDLTSEFEYWEDQEWLNNG